MKMTKIEKKQLMIYVIVAYGITYLLGLFMWYGYASGKDVSVFPNAQMLYPAAGVMLAYLLTRKGESEIPRRFFVAYLIVTLLMILCAVCSVIAGGTFWMMICQLVLIGGSILCGILILLEKRESCELYGLNWKNSKVSIFCIFLFVGLYVLRTAIASGMSGQLGRLAQIGADPTTWLMLLSFLINFFLSLVAFFGEEYGWRYYLQPLLQRRYGKRVGVLLLGVVWGIWHLPVNFFYYSPGSGLISAVGQQITCITLGIFFAYAYMKTENIWVPVILHFLNNNLVPVLSGTYSAEVLQNQSISWGSLLPALILNGVIFGGFLFARVFRKEKEEAAL